MSRSCYLSSFVELHSAVSEEKWKMSQPIRGRDSHSVFPIGPKNTTWQRTLGSCFLSRFVEFRSVVSEKGEKCLSESETGQPFCFTDRSKNRYLVKDVEILRPIKFCEYSSERFKGGGSKKCFCQSEVWAAIFLSQLTRKSQTWWKTLRCGFLSSFVEFRSAVSEKIAKMFQSIRGHSGHIGFPIWNIATNVASMFTYTCRLFSIFVTSSKYVDNFGNRSSLFLKLFPQIYGFQQAKPIHNLTIRIGFACWNRKI